METRIAGTRPDGVTIRGRDLVQCVIGERTYTETLYFLISGRFPDVSETRILDACLVTLMEHGWTPSSIVTRFVIDSVPEEIQVAIASGLMTVGSVFAGTAEACGALLRKAVDQSEPLDAYFASTVAEYRSRKAPIPGFGHPVHKPDDPRAAKLIAIGRQLRPDSRYIAALLTLSSEVDKALGRHMTINATGAIAALLLEIGLPTDVMRGLAVASRAGGLIGHVMEERETHASRDIWKQAEERHPYRE